MFETKCTEPSLLQVLKIASIFLRVPDGWMEYVPSNGLPLLEYFPKPIEKDTNLTPFLSRF